VTALTAKTVIVTGAASPGGIGAVTAALAADRGAQVVLADRDSDGADRLAAEIAANGGTVFSLYVDLAEDESVERLVEAVVDRFGGVDVLVNNAAATELAATADSSVVEMDTAVWDQTMRVNLRGTMLACKYSIPSMQQRGGGSIINIVAEGAALGDLKYTAYGVSKAAIIALSKYVATQYGKQGVRCNAVSPGVVRTPMSESKLSGATAQMLLRHHLAPRLGRADDIAHMVLFLASDEAAFVTGQVIGVSGGLAVHQPYYADLVDELEPAGVR
jgi:NAD(P)-dependent dehydrogenase (short-subunit alcohol dehydrogenase family)